MTLFEFIVPVIALAGGGIYMLRRSEKHLDDKTRQHPAG
jgi:hypothetical protein